MGNQIQLWSCVLVLLLGSICFANVLPSLQFYITQHGGNKVFLGAVTSAYAVGQIMTASLLGWWSDRRNAREPIAFGLALILIGNMSYAFAYLQTTYAKYIILAARFIVGAGSANAVVCQNYIAKSTTASQKTLYLTMGSLAQALGFIIGPAMAMLNGFMHFDYKFIHANESTLPGLVSGVLAFFSLIFVLIMFREKKIKISGDGYAPLKTHEENENDDNNGNNGEMEQDQSSNPKEKSSQVKDGVWFWIAIGILMIMNFICLASFTIFETILTEFTKETWQWGVKENKICFAISAVICVVGFILLMVVNKCVSERICLIFAFMLLAAGYGSVIDYSGNQLGLYRLYIMVVGGSIGYPWGIILVLSTFSKLLGDRKQGSLLGWLTAAGAFSRVICPFTAGFVYEHYGAAALWSGVVGLIIFGLALSIIGFPLLKTDAVPKKKRKKEEDLQKYAPPTPPTPASEV